MRSKLTSPTLTSNCRKTWWVLYLKKCFFLQKHIANIFLIHTQCQKMTFRCSFYVMTSVVWLQPTPLPPLHVVFTVVSPPEGGRCPAWLWFAVRQAPVRILSSFWSRAMQGVGGVGFLDGPALSLFLNGLLTPHCSGQIIKTGSLYSTVTPIVHATPFMDWDL